MNGVNSDLIRQIRNRAAELQKKSIAVVVDEGFHRSSTNDDYYQGGADALRELASNLEQQDSLGPIDPDTARQLLGFPPKSDRPNQGS